jgi:hypothetical protein
MLSSGYSSASPAQYILPQAPPPSPSSLRPDWIYLSTGIIDAHIGERQIYVDGRPTNRHTGITLITSFEQSQCNPYPIGPEIGLLWKTPSLAAYGTTEIGVGFTAYRSSAYTTATVLGFRVGHDLADGINAGVIVGPIFFQGTLSPSRLRPNWNSTSNRSLFANIGTSLKSSPMGL